MTLVWFITLVGVLITVHELGHLVAAKMLDIKVLKLSVGFGPTLTSFKRGDTEYAVSVFPLGGYVRLLGEDRQEAIPPEDTRRAFHHKPAWQRLVVILAGPLANLLFPIVIFAHLYAQENTTRSATLGTVIAGQPAHGADLRVGDKVIAVDEQAVTSWDDLNAYVLASPGKELKITVERPGLERPITKVVTPRVHVRTDPLGKREQVGLIGIAPHYRLPQVGVIDERTAAYRAGLRTFDVITSIQGRPVQTAADLEALFNPRSAGMLVVTYLRPQHSSLGFAGVARLEPATAQVVPDAGPKPGRFDAGLRAADLFVHSVEPGSAAANLGLTSGDILVALDGVTLSSWEMFAQALEEHPQDEHQVAWHARDGEHSGRFRLKSRRERDEYQSEATFWVFGAEGARAIEPVPEVALERHLLGALGHAVGRALSVTGTLVRVLGLTLVGQLPATSIGGPILIYEVAGIAAQHGVEQFLVMAALVSLNLGLLNLLPVPLLDGGQASLVMLEVVRRKPISPRVRERAAYVGVALLLALLLLASRNDIMRHFLP